MPTNAQDQAEVKGRGKPSDEGRFLWLSSLAVERIVNELGATQAAYGIAVYVALARLSSQSKNNPQVSASVGKLAGMARLSYRKTFEILHGLEGQAKVIAITAGERQPGQSKQAPSTYTLLALRLHNGKSGRLHNRKSPDCTRDTQQTAENPKDSPVGRDKKKTEEAAATGIASQPIAASSVSKKVTWDGRCDP